MDHGRRDTLKFLGAAALAGVAGLPSPRRTAAQTTAVSWNKEAFEARSLGDVLKALGATDAAPTTDLSWGATPQIAENGAVVPINVTSRIPRTQAVAIIIEKNPNKLAANFRFPEGTEPSVSTRVKISESSPVHALVRTADGKHFIATREIKVTLGGCGG